MTMRQIVTEGLASIFTDVPTLRPGSVAAYALAFASAGIATVMRLAIDPYVMGAECLPFFPAVIITALIGGLDAGLFCVVLSAVAVTFLQMPPLTLLLFVLLAIFLVILITRMRLAIQREQAAQAIQASRDRLQFTLDMAKLGSWQYDPHRQVLTGDTRIKKIFDVTTEEMSIEDIKKLMHPDDAETFWADRTAAIDPANPKPSPHEYRVQRRDGQVRWVEVGWFVYFHGDQRKRGTASVVGTVHDITERKGREEREHLLMSEINHRAKNMLSVVDAIAHQTVTRNPEDFIERFSERIQSLSANQDLLIRNAWQGVEVEALVRAQLAPFADLMGSRIVVRGPKFRLNAASAQAIGLALTNSPPTPENTEPSRRIRGGWKSAGGPRTRPSR